LHDIGTNPLPSKGHDEDLEQWVYLDSIGFWYVTALDWWFPPSVAQAAAATSVGIQFLAEATSLITRYQHKHTEISTFPPHQGWAAFSDTPEVDAGLARGLEAAKAATDTLWSSDRF